MILSLSYTVHTATGEQWTGIAYPPKSERLSFSLWEIYTIEGQHEVVSRLKASSFVVVVLFESFPALLAASYLAMENATSQQTAEALHYLQAKVPSKLHQPVIGIICGSGMNGLADAVLPDPRFEIPYTDIPHFPPSTGMC